MKKGLLATLFSLLICCSTSFALSSEDIPDEFDIIQHWVSLTTSYDIETKTHKLGTLYRKFFSLSLAYEFLDPFGKKLATARSVFFSIMAHFDIYDADNQLLGIAEEKFTWVYPTFDIYGKDGVTKLATAEMNFWGTRYTMYDPMTHEEIAYMHRPFVRLKNDWTFKVVDRDLLMQKNIDPRVLLTVVAFQSDKEYWNRYRTQNSLGIRTLKATKKEVPDALDSSLTFSEIQALLKEAHAILANDTQLLEPNDLGALEPLANELEAGYKQTHAGDNQEGRNKNKEDAKAFIQYCLNRAREGGISNIRKAQIIYLIIACLENESASLDINSRATSRKLK